MADAQPTGQPDEYFATKLNQPFLDAAKEFERNWLYTVQGRGIWRQWWLIYCQLLGIDPHTGVSGSHSSLTFVGEQQQFINFRIQITRKLIQERTMMAKDVRPSFAGVATTNDAAAEAEVNISTRAVEYMVTEGKLEDAVSAALTILGNFGESFVMQTWDYDAGDDVPAREPVIDPNTGQPLQTEAYDLNGQLMVEQDPQTGAAVPMLQPVTQTVQKPSGAPKAMPLYPWQCARDPYLERDHLCMVVKIPVNKHEIAAKYAANDPAKAARIKALKVDSELGDDALFAWGDQRSVSSDTIVMRMLFHADCAAIPGGRWAGYVQDVDLWGVDKIVPCPLKKGIPVKPLIDETARYFGTAFGYPVASDILALQTVLNECASALVTNFQRAGNANAYKSDDVAIDPVSWSMGGRLIDIPAGREPPKWDEPPQMSPLAEFLMNFVLTEAKGMLGSNSVTSGNPDANISSGSFAVLMVNLAQKYANGMQETYDHAYTDSANDALELIRANAQNGFWAEIAGIGEAPYVELMSTERLSSLRKVKMVRQHPVLSTFPGRMEVFQQIAPLPPAERQAAAEALLNGRLDALVDADQSSAIRIRKENELMLQGIPVEASMFDPHPIEFPKHRAALDKLRTQGQPQDPQAAMLWQQAKDVLTAHMNQHAVLLAQTPLPVAVLAGNAQLPEPGGDPANDNGDPAQQQQAAQGGAPSKHSGGGKQPKRPKAPKPPKPPAGYQGNERVDP